MGFVCSKALSRALIAKKCRQPRCALRAAEQNSASRGGCVWWVRPNNSGSSQGQVKVAPEVSQGKLESRICTVRISCVCKYLAGFRQHFGAWTSQQNAQRVMTLTGYNDCLGTQMKALAHWPLVTENF